MRIIKKKDLDKVTIKLIEKYAVDFLKQAKRPGLIERLNEKLRKKALNIVSSAQNLL